jgi:hypothetical protein
VTTATFLVVFFDGAVTVVAAIGASAGLGGGVGLGTETGDVGVGDEDDPASLSLSTGFLWFADAGAQEAIASIFLDGRAVTTSMVRSGFFCAEEIIDLPLYYRERIVRRAALSSALAHPAQPTAIPSLFIDRTKGSMAIGGNMGPCAFRIAIT